MDAEFEQTPGGSEGQGSLACCNPWLQTVKHDRATEQQQVIHVVLQQKPTRRRKATMLQCRN